MRDESKSGGTMRDDRNFNLRDTVKTLTTSGNRDFLILDGGMRDNLKLTAECYPENKESNQKGSG